MLYLNDGTSGQSVLRTQLFDSRASYVFNTNETPHDTPDEFPTTRNMHYPYLFMFWTQRIPYNTTVGDSLSQFSIIHTV